MTICRSRQITNHDSTLNQSVRYQVTCFMEGIPSLPAFLLGDAGTDLRQVKVAPGFLLAPGPLCIQLIELSVIPARAFHPTNRVDPPVLIDPHCQGLEAQVKRHHTPRLL